MRIECYIYLPPAPNRKYQVGEIELTQDSIILKKRNKFLYLGFGLIGRALTKSKEFDRVEWSKVESITMDKAKLMRNACFINLKDGEKYILNVPQPKQIIPRMQEVFNQIKALEE